MNGYLYFFHEIFYFFALTVVLFLSISSCKKSSLAAADNYIILNGIKHEINFAVFEKTDSSFYFEMDSIMPNHASAFLFSFINTGQMTLGQYLSYINLPDGFGYNAMSFYDNLLTSTAGPAIPVNNRGTLTITNVGNGRVSGYFDGILIYYYPSPSPVQDTLTFSGAFNNDVLTSK